MEQQNNTMSDTKKKAAAKKAASTKEFAKQAPVPKSTITTSVRMAYKISEAARLISVSENSIRRLIKNGDLKGCRKLRHFLIPHSAIEEFLGVQEAA